MRINGQNVREYYAKHGAAGSLARFMKDGHPETISGDASLRTCLYKMREVPPAHWIELVVYPYRDGVQEKHNIDLQFVPELIRCYSAEMDRKG